MKREYEIIVVKFMIVTILTIIYVFFVMYYIAPLVTQTAFGQYDQFNNPNQYSDPNQFNQGQFGQNQFQGGYDQNQFQNQQFQQPYQSYQQPYGMNTQYGTPYQQPYNYNQTGYGGFGIQEIITALIAGGGAAGYTRYRTNRLEDDKQTMMSEILKGKQVDAELARITYQMNKEKSDMITDAPSVKLETLQNDVNQFTDKTAKS